MSVQSDFFGNFTPRKVLDIWRLVENGAETGDLLDHLLDFGVQPLFEKDVLQGQRALHVDDVVLPHVEVDVALQHRLNLLHQFLLRHHLLEHILGARGRREAQVDMSVLVVVQIVFAVRLEIVDELLQAVRIGRVDHVQDIAHGVPFAEQLQFLHLVD